MKSQRARILPAIILGPFITGINALAVDGIQQPCGSTYKKRRCADEEPHPVCGAKPGIHNRSSGPAGCRGAVLIKRQRGDKIHVADRLRNLIPRRIAPDHDGIGPV